MKFLASVTLLLSLSLISVAQSQDQSTGQSGQSSQGSQSQSTSANQGQSSNSKHNMSGTVSHDRQTLKGDNGKSYKVDNPDTLQGKQDQRVALIVQVDPDNNVIHVLQVEAPQQ
jgi:hypothetical protein